MTCFDYQKVTSKVTSTFSLCKAKLHYLRVCYIGHVHLKIPNEAPWLERCPSIQDVKIESDKVWEYFYKQVLLYVNLIK